MERSPDEPGLWRLAHIGMELAGAVVGLGLVGLWVDWQFGTRPWGVLTGAGLGLAGGMYLFIKQAVAAAKAADTQWTDKDRKRRPPAGHDREEDEHEQEKS